MPAPFLFGYMMEKEKKTNTKTVSRKEADTKPVEKKMDAKVEDKAPVKKAETAQRRQPRKLVSVLKLNK